MWEFITSSSEKSNWYMENGKEVCFIGRSNVGKSTLINAITNQKALARTSNTPGRTQLLNFFGEDKKVIVDLPGYGYAKMPKKVKDKMNAMINEYFLERQQLLKAFILVDSKVGPTKDDVSMMSFLKEIDLPFMVIMTKEDKPNQSMKSKTEKKIREFTDDYIFVSSKSGKNIDKVRKIINSTFK